MSTTQLMASHTEEAKPYTSNQAEALGDKVSNIGVHALRFSIATVLAWIGAMKFTAYEAGAIEGLVASNPLTSWLYAVTSVQGAANLIGSVEIFTAVLIVLGVKFPKLALVGAISALATFFVTSSLLLTTPGWEPSLGGFPALSVVPGQFLLKDIVLFSGAIFLIGNALKRIAKQN